jgi:hypothetical protein
MNQTTLLLQLIAGALGGYAAGSVSKEMNLGTIGNSVAGALGGGVGGQILFAILVLSGTVQSLDNWRHQRGTRYTSHWISEIEDIDLRRPATVNVS